MRIKHWAGYGTVLARKINDGAAKLHVRVEGTHEMGVMRDVWDKPLLYNWLVKRFDKEVPPYAEWVRRIPLIDAQIDFRNDPKLGCLDIVDYYFDY